MSNNGKGGNNRKNHHRFSKRKGEQNRHEHKKQNENFFADGKIDKNRVNVQERLRWAAPVLPPYPITSPECPWCGKEIKDIAAAITDKDSGKPVHFDCVLSRITDMESPEKNDSVCYIGGGRFGVIHFPNPANTKSFSIKKIYEWEAKDFHSQWREPICEYFSLT